MNRKPFAFPDYYPSTFERVDKLIRDAFLHEEGPSTLPASRRDVNVSAVIAPCDSYDKIPPCAVWAYKEIAESNFQDTYIVMGTNHCSDIKISTYTFTDWETPLGPVKVDKDFGKELINFYPKVINEHTAHEEEYSVEVQLPFLQFASRDNLHKLKFLPLALNLSKIEDVKEFAGKLNEFVKGKKATIIASSTVEDTATLQYVKTLNTEGLINYRERKKKEVKEVAPILVLMEMAKLNNEKAIVLNCVNAYQITKNKDDVKYYASVLFK